MSDTELRYVDYDTDAVWTEILKAYLQAGGDTLYPGDEKEILLRAVQAIAEAILSKVDSALRMNTLSYATGEYLKEYGLKRGCKYIEAVPAKIAARMSFSAGGSGTIEKGALLTADGKLLYATVEDIVLTGQSQTEDVILECATAGEAGNATESGTRLQMLNSPACFTGCVTTGAGYGGVDAEDEESYRERIRAYMLSAVTTGTKRAYESKAREVSAQIVDARAINDGDGEVGIYLILTDDAVQADVFAAVEEALSAEDTRPLTDDVHVYAATEVEYTLTPTVYYDSFAASSAQVQKAVDEYQAWQDEHIGRAFNPDKLRALLLATGCERVEFGENDGIEGSMEYATISERAHCKGTITFTIAQG